MARLGYFAWGTQAWGGGRNRWTGAGGTGVLVVICLVLKTLIKNPSR